MNNETQKEIKNWKLKRLRKKYGLTQQDLADFLNISRTAYQYLESKGNLTSDILVRLSHFFGIDISEIVADEDIERPGSRLHSPIERVDFVHRILSNDEMDLLVMFDKMTPTQRVQLLTIAHTLVPEEK